MVGERLGHYEITAELGAGGMGRVYRARDTRLQRDVALKVLLPELVEDAERLARFEREARTLATLQHPNIASIYGFEQHGDRRFLVMELVEGDDLGARLAFGRYAVEDAIAVAARVARGLEAAHEQGVVHRDLKPANIQVMSDGDAKILDFGLAKALVGEETSDASDRSVSPTLTSAGSQVGTILGTAAYMSPEQARGRPVDRRTDIWAFGCVLYEMLAGRAPFGGESVTDVLADIVKTEPDYESLPPDTPGSVRRLIQRCLDKVATTRLRDIGEARLVLESPDSEMWAGGGPAPRSAPRLRRVVPIVAGLFVGLVLGAAFGPMVLRGPDADSESAVARFHLELDGATPLITPWHDLTISPAGDVLAFVTEQEGVGTFQGANSVLTVRRLDRLTSTTLASTRGAVAPFLSPDGSAIGYINFVERRLERIPIEGGTATVIAEGIGSSAGSVWTEDGTIVHADGGGKLLAIPASGGTPELLAEVDRDVGEATFARPLVVPGGQVIVGLRLDGERGRIVTLDRSTGVRRDLVDGDVPLAITPAGRLVFQRGRALFAQRLAAGSTRVAGAGVPLLEGVSDDVAVSADGTLVYRVGDIGDRRPGRVVWIDADGQASPAITGELVYPRYPRLSPDGDRVALTVGAGADGRVWVYDLAGKRAPYNVTHERHSVFPTWSPDGGRIAFFGLDLMASGGRLYTTAADGSELEASRLDVPASSSWVPSAWTRDDRLIASHATDGGSPSEVVAIPLSPAGPAVELISTPFREGHAALSPDERWIAYESDRSGTFEIWARPFPSGAPVRVSSSGGLEPVWSRDGEELYFQSGNAMMAARVAAADPELRFETPRELFRESFQPKTLFTPRTYDVHPDGRFLMLQMRGEGDRRTRFVVVRNWLSEVDRRVEAGR